MYDSQIQKGFTLIELLVVIGLVAILSTVVILTLNPAELLRQARDSNRISDLNTMKSAISLYLVDASTTDLDGSLGVGFCWNSTAATSSNCNMESTWTSTSSAAASARKVNGSGWIPVKLTDISSGAPISNWPLDPTNNESFYYAYAASSSANAFEIDAFMESKKFSNTGGGDVESTDGGGNNDRYEVGNIQGLNF